MASRTAATLRPRWWFAAGSSRGPGGPAAALDGPGTTPRPREKCRDRQAQDPREHRLARDGSVHRPADSGRRDGGTRGDTVAGDGHRAARRKHDRREDGRDPADPGRSGRHLPGRHDLEHERRDRQRTGERGDDHLRRPGRCAVGPVRRGALHRPELPEPLRHRPADHALQRGRRDGPERAHDTAERLQRRCGRGLDQRPLPAGDGSGGRPAQRVDPDRHPLRRLVLARAERRDQPRHRDRRGRGLPACGSSR